MYLGIIFGLIICSPCILCNSIADYINRREQNRVNERPQQIQANINLYDKILICQKVDSALSHCTICLEEFTDTENLRKL